MCGGSVLSQKVISKQEISTLQERKVCVLKPCVLKAQESSAPSKLRPRGCLSMEIKDSGSSQTSSHPHQVFLCVSWPRIMVQPLLKMICSALILSLPYWSLGSSQRNLKDGFVLSHMLLALRYCCSIQAATGLWGALARVPMPAAGSDNWPERGCTYGVANTSTSAECHHPICPSAS